jgi:hypothetical protein
MVYIPTTDRKENSINAQKRPDKTAILSVQSVAISFMLWVDFGVADSPSGSLNPSGY